MQRTVEVKNQGIYRAQEEGNVYKRQIEKLLEELREKSDSESVEDAEAAMEQAKKA